MYSYVINLNDALQNFCSRRIINTHEFLNLKALESQLSVAMVIHNVLYLYVDIHFKYTQDTVGIEVLGARESW